MKRAVQVALCGILLLGFGLTTLLAALVVDSAAVSPGTATVGVATQVTVTAVISEPSVLPDGVNLQKLDTANRVIAVLGLLRDDGTGGDAAANDKIFTLRTTVFETSPGPVRLRVSAAFRGSIVRANSSVLTVNVTGTTATGITILSPANQSYLSTSPINVSGSVGDPGATVTVNGIPAPVTAGTFQLTVPLVEGTNTLTAVANNSGGTTSTSSVQVTLDTTPPRVTIESPASNLVTTDTAVTVAGTVNDIVVGTVNTQQATVTVNGLPAQVANRSFLAAPVPLAMGLNTIQAITRDRAGNQATMSIQVTRQPPTSPLIRLISGNNQSGPVSSLLGAPLVVGLDDGQGHPVANTPVVFRVTDNNGTLGAGTASGPSIAVTTNSQGQAQVSLRLGARSGSGGNRVEATATGFVGTAAFTATGVPTGATLITLDSGNNQTGALGEKLAFPFVVVVTDSGYNRISGVPVTFTVKQGGGNFASQPSTTTNTDPDGRALAVLTLGTQPGIDNNVVEASFPGNSGTPASFVATAKAPGNIANTRISGVVLDNSNNPIVGVTMRLFKTNQGNANNTPQPVGTPVQTDAQGSFVMQPVPVGYFKLMADGTTVPAPRGVFPTLEYDIVTVAGQDNVLGMPIFLPVLDTVNKLCVSPTTGGTLTLPKVPGFSLTVAAGSATFPGGSRTGCVTVSTVNPDKSPMSPGFGQQPRFLITIQPVGTTFNPPAPITMPNVDGLLPGQVTELYSYDHDLSAFTAIGTGTVSADGLLIKSDPGVGIIKAGWHCGGNPNSSGSVASLNLSVSPTSATKAVGDKFDITASGSPPLDAVYSWEVLATQAGDDPTMVTLTSAPSCANQPTCKATAEVKKAGGITIRVHFKCTTTGVEVTKDVRVTAADIKFLDRNDIELDPAVSALKISKFVTNQNFDTTDPDNLKVQVTDSAVSGNTVTVNLSSAKASGTALDSLNNLTLNKVPSTNKFRSGLLRLVADTVDKASESTRTLVAATDGKVSASYTGPPNGTAEINTCKPADIRTVTFSIFILRNKPLASGGTEVISQASVQGDLALANQQYGQICVKLSAAISIVDPPAGVDLSDGLDEFTVAGVPTAEEKALLDGLATASTADIQMFWVNSLSNGSRGEAFIPQSSTGANAKYANNEIVSNSRTPFTLGHELGHVLLNEGAHHGTQTNLMRNSTSPANAVDASKRLDTTQETTIRSHALAK